VLVDPPRFIMPPLFVLGTLRFIILLPLFVPLPEVLGVEHPVAASAIAANQAATTTMSRFWRITAPFDEGFVPGAGCKLARFSSDWHGPATVCSHDCLNRRLADSA
jgi:hypothetical protein